MVSLTQEWGPDDKKCRSHKIQHEYMHIFALHSSAVQVTFSMEMYEFDPEEHIQKVSADSVVDGLYYVPISESAATLSPYQNKPKTCHFHYFLNATS